MKKTTAAIIAVLTLALTGTACSNDSTSSKPSSDNVASTTMTSTTMALPSGVNTADVTFAQSMIPHHQQAVAMSKTVLSAGSDAAVKALAQRINDAQDPEITTMTGWLKTWGRPLRSTGSMDGMAGMSDSSPMDGMMSDTEMKSLDAATGSALDALYVNLMIKHHQGAVRMAETEVKDGENLDAIDLAKKIITSQNAEISEMQALLPTLKSA